MANVMYNRPSIMGPDLTQPQAPIAAAPADPSQIGLWQKFKERVQNDPNLRMALLTAGSNMLRTPEFGQSGFDVFANAAGTGIQTLDQLRQRDFRQGERQGDREFEQGATTRRLEQGDRQLGQGEERIDIARTGVEQRGEALQINRAQLAENVRQFEKTLGENARMFDERLAAGGFTYGGGGADSTGPERMASIAKEAFLGSGLYPRTEQGESLATLRAQGLIGKDLATSQDRMDFAADMAKDLILFNKGMSTVDAVAQAMELANALAEQSNLSSPATIQPHDPLVGQTVTHPTNAALSGTLAPGSEPGTYKIVNAQGVAGIDVPHELVMKLLHTQGTE